MNERVLLVDDEPLILELASTILARGGFEVVTANSGEQACDKIAVESFDLLCTDINMPRMNGFSVIRGFKEKSPNTPVLVMTGLKEFNLATDIAVAGIEGFVQKPFGREDLLVAVNNALKKKTLRDKNVRLKSIYPLFEVNHVLMHHPDMSDMFNVVMEIIQKEAGADSVSIAIKNDDGSFSIVAAAGLTEGYCSGYRLKEEGIAVQVAKSGQPIILHNEREGSFQGMMVREELSSAMIIPLKVKGEVIGVLSIANRKGRSESFCKSDLDFMVVIAGQASMSLRNKKLFEELEAFFFGSIRAFSSAIDAKSPWTAGHSERVASYACLLGWHMGLSGSELEELEVAALLHDVGKIAVSEAVLEKADELTKAESLIVEGHTDRGVEILKHIKPLRALIPTVRAHHEHYDGSGYPDGLSGKDIPFLARILAVVDSYDAMKSERPYRRGQSIEYIIAEFKKCAGTQFDPAVVGPFLEILGDKKLHADLLIKVPDIRKMHCSLS